MAHTVDYYGCVYVTPQLGDLATVRRRTKMAPPKSALLVDYALLPENDWPHIHVPSVSRWVLHVSFDTVSQGEGASFELITPDKPLDMVIVFHYSASEHEQGEEHEPLGDHIPEHLGIMNDFKVAAIRATEKGSVTFVGVESLPPQVLGMPGGLQPLEVVDRAKAGIEAELIRNLNHGMNVAGKNGKRAIQHVMERISWLTFSDWSASLPISEKVIAAIPEFSPAQWPGAPTDTDHWDPAFGDGFSDFSDDSDF